jgi:hypothetical protein
VIEAALAGKAATSLWEGERKFAVAVRLPAEDRAGRQPERTPSPRRWRLRAAGRRDHITETSGAMNIARSRPAHHRHRHLHQGPRHGLGGGRHEGPVAKIDIPDYW